VHRDGILVPSHPSPQTSHPSPPVPALILTHTHPSPPKVRSISTRPHRIFVTKPKAVIIKVRIMASPSDHFLAYVNSCSCSLYVVVRPSVCRLSSVTFVHPTQAIEIFGNVSTPFGTSAICNSSVKILRRSSQGNPSVGGFNQRGVEKCNDFGPFQGYISETVQDRR